MATTPDVALSPEKQGAYDAMMKDYYSHIPDSGQAERQGHQARRPVPPANAKPGQPFPSSPMRWRNSAQLRAERMTLGDKMEKRLGIPARPRHDGQRYDGRRHGYHSGGRHGGDHGGHGGRRTVTAQHLLSLRAPGDASPPRNDTPDTLQARGPYELLSASAATRNMRGQPLHHNSNVSSTTSLPAPRPRGLPPRSRCLIQ